MRRELKLDDFETGETYQVSGEGVGGAKKFVATNTDEFKMKDISIETLIRSSNKQDFGMKIDPHTLLLESKHDELQTSPKHNSNRNNEENKEDEGEQESEEATKKLIKFLRKVGPLVDQEIGESLPLYENFGKNEDQTFFKRESRLTTTLENLDLASEEKLEISDVSWNATGVIIGAVYSKPDHEGTCSHKSMVCLWALLKRNFKPTRPDVISTPNCINCISFHPKKPSVFACGSYTGEVLLYDYSRTEEQLFAKTSIDEYFHRDLITKLSWWPYRQSGKSEISYNLLSLGTDGKILLWEVSNQSIGEDALAQKSKNLLKYPIKGFLMLRRKEKETIPVSGLTMNQSKIEKNYFIVGSEGGSILRATLHPVFASSEAKVILDLQTTVKFKKEVYPFLCNVPLKNLPDLKANVEKYCTKNKLKEVENLGTVFQSNPEIIKIYPNPISFAYEPLAFPISSISDNKYGLFIVNAYEGYSRVYLESYRSNLECIEEGWEWGWLNGSHLMGGFIGQEWAVVDWTTGSVIWSVGVGEGRLWKEQGKQVAIVCERTKVKIIELGDKLFNESEEKHKDVIRKIDELKVE